MFEKLAVGLVALVGTLVATLIGLYQWRQQRQDSQRHGYREDRARTYRDLWVTLEEINLNLRNETFPSAGNPSLFSMLREINTFFIQNSLYLDESDHQFIVDYIHSLDELRKAIYTTEGNSDAVAAWERTWPTIPKPVSDAIDAASAEVQERRAHLLARVRKVVSDAGISLVS